MEEIKMNEKEKELLKKLLDSKKQIEEILKNNGKEYKELPNGVRYTRKSKLKVSK